MDTMHDDSLTAVPFTEAYGRALCTWQYEGAYAIYTMDPWQACVAKGYSIADPAQWDQFCAVCRGDEFVGFFRLSPEGRGRMVGLGLRPDLCGQGLGRALVALMLDFARIHMPDTMLSLEVRTFNERAIRCYGRAGFQIVREYVRDTPTGPGGFYLMERPAIKTD